MRNDPDETVLPVIMAGGEGSRLRPLTDTLPKPLLPLDGVPVIERLLGRLRLAGFSRAVVTVRYLGEKLKQALGEQCAGVRLLWFSEDGKQPLGTAGSVRAAAERYARNERDILVLSGDAVTDADLAAFLRFHRERGADASLLSVRVPDPCAYGLILSEPDGRITGFLEKPSVPEAVTDAVNTGMYLLTRHFVYEISPERAQDFGGDVFPAALKAGKALYAFPADCFWCDIGAFDDFLSCALLSAAGKLPGTEKEKVRRSLPARLRGNSIGDGCFVPEDASVRESALFHHVHIGGGASVFRSIIASGAVIGKNAVLGEGCVIGENAVIGDRAVLPRGTHIPAESVVPGDTENASAPAENADGYLLSADADSALPDPVRCVRFGTALAAYLVRTAERSDDGTVSVVFLQTDASDALLSAERMVLEGLRVRCGNRSGCRIFFVTGVTASDAAADPGLSALPELNVSDAEDALLRVIFRLSGNSPTAVPAGRSGFPLASDRMRERMFGRMLSEAGAGSVSGGSSGTVAPVTEIPASRVTLRFRNTLLSRAEIFAPGFFRYGTDRTRGEDADLRLLSGLFSACFGEETPDAPVVLSLVRDAETGRCVPSVRLLTEDGKSAEYGKWELYAMLTAAFPDRHFAVPVTAPLWLDLAAQRTGAALMRYTRGALSGGMLSSAAETPDGTRLLFLLCAHAARIGRERGLSEADAFLSLWRSCTGTDRRMHVRAGRDGSLPASASAVRRLSETGAFVPAGEGVLNVRPDGSTVRVTQTRAHTFRLTADAYSSEQAEELLSETEALLAKILQ